MEKEKIEKLILKSVKEKKFEELTTNFEIINFITGEVIKDESFIINLRNELLKSKEDFNLNNNPVITNLLLCIYSSALNIILNEIINIKKEIVLKEKEHEKIIKYLNIELDICLKQTEFVEKIKKSMNIIIEPNLLKRFEKALESVHEEIIYLINYIRLEQIIKIMTQQKGF